MAKIIDMKTRGEIVAFFPSREDTREEALKALNQAIKCCEQMLGHMERDSKLITGRTAFEAFMMRLGPTLQEAGEGVRITDQTSWIKIEGVNSRHRVYVSKGRNSVNRVDSTLPAHLVPGAVVSSNRNGLIASWLPADVESVAFAIRLITSPETPPLRK